MTGSLRARDLFKDADKLERILIKDYGLDESLVHSIMGAKINISQVYCTPTATAFTHALHSKALITRVQI